MFLKIYPKWLWIWLQNVSRGLKLLNSVLSCELNIYLLTFFLEKPLNLIYAIVSEIFLEAQTDIENF